jgi:hypothetical protein
MSKQDVAHVNETEDRDQWLDDVGTARNLKRYFGRLERRIKNGRMAGKELPLELRQILELDVEEMRAVSEMMADGVVEVEE